MSRVNCPASPRGCATPEACAAMIARPDFSLETALGGLDGLATLELELRIHGVHKQTTTLRDLVRDSPQAVAAPAATPRMASSRMPRSGSTAKACTEVSTPERTRKVPSRDSENAAMASSSVQLEKLPRFSVVACECSKAAPINQGMKLAFLEMRAERLIAKIHADNTRSLKAFERCGFLLHNDAPALKSLSMNSEHYLRLLREGAAGDATGNHITEVDQARLRNLLALAHPSAVFELEHEVERATVVEPHQVPEDVVTMNSRAVVRLDGEAVEVALVYPEEADDSAGKFSVCSDVGTAILGYKEGDAFDWRMTHRTRHVRIEKVLYQPEAAGHFHL